MEAEHGIDRFVNTGADPERLERFENRLQEQFEKKNARDIASLERDQTETERKVIALANEDLNARRAVFGLPPYEVPESVIHIIPQERWPRPQAGGETIPLYQEIAVADNPERLIVAERLHHEMTHWQSYIAIEAGKRTAQDYRLGLSGYTRPNHVRYNNVLNEGVTAELTRQFMLQLRENPLFLEEFRATENVRQHAPDAVDTNGDRLFQDDTYLARVADVRTGKAQLKVQHVTYREERRALGQLLKKLSRIAPPERLKHELERGVFTGQLLTLGKMIDGAFGKGVFRLLSQTQTVKEFLHVVESLD